MAATVQAEKLHSHFSIENILRKEDKIIDPSSKRSVSSYSDLSLHDLEDHRSSRLESWKKEYLDECKRDCCSKTITHDDIPVLENRHRLTEHWVYENHFQRPRTIPTLRSHAFPPVLPTTKRPSYSSSSDIELVPSPSPTSTWSPPPPMGLSKKQHSLEYWFLDRMMRNCSGGSTPHPSGHGFASNNSRRPLPDSSHPLRYYWNSSAMHDDRDAFSGLLGRTNRLKSNLTIDDDDSDEGNRKGGQVRFTHTQSTELERVFSIQKYVSPQERKQLARSIDLSERQVKTWFQNRRAKWRRIKLEDEMRARMANDNTSTHPNTTRNINDTNATKHFDNTTTCQRDAIVTNKHENTMINDDTELRLDYRVREDNRMC